MSETAIENAVAELDAAIDAVETPREPITDYSLLRNNRVLTVADEHSPNDASLDKFMVLDTFRESSTGSKTFSAYEFNESWNVGNSVSGLDVARIMAVNCDVDYSEFSRDMRFQTSAGKFGNVYADNFPREIYALGEWYNGGKAFFEVLSVDGDKATVRLFCYGATENDDFIERGEHTVESSLLSSCMLYFPEHFTEVYGLAKDLYPVGTVFEYKENLWSVTSHSYRFLKLQKMDDDGTVSGRQSTVGVSETEAYGWVKLADSFEDYQKSLPDEATAELLKKLSINTVSSALKHADKNEYCSETAVALASAGHSLPELRVKGTVTMDIDVSTKEYMLLRKLFGATEGRPDEALSKMFNSESPDMRLYRTLQQESRGALPEIKEGKNTKFELSAELVWKAPRIRK